MYFYVGDVIVSVPEKLLITVQIVMQSSIGPFVSHLQRFPILILSVFLIFDRQCKDTIWAPYLNTLPRTYSTPAFFTRSEFALLPAHAKLKATCDIEEVCFSKAFYVLLK